MWWIAGGTYMAMGGVVFIVASNTHYYDHGGLAAAMMRGAVAALVWPVPLTLELLNRRRSRG